MRLCRTERIGQAVRAYPSWMRARRLLSQLLHAEPRASHRFDRRGRPAHLDMCRALPPEEVEQQLARRSGDKGGRFAPPCSNGLSGPRPLKLKSCTAQSPCEEPGRATDVAPQGLVHRMLVRSRTTTVGSAYVLVVDEELVEAREPAHPSDPEEAWRRSRSDRRDEPGEVPQRERSSTPFRKAAPRTGQDEPGPARGSRSRRTRCAAISRVVHGSRRVGASGPSSSNRSLSCARSAASKSRSAISPELARSAAGFEGR